MDRQKILIVEDENIVARDIENSLEGLGYKIPGIATCGEEAIKKARESSPDLILMDIMLKGEMDGIGAVQAMRQIMDVPVVYLTACADQTTLDRAKATEPFGYILKPFEEKELQTAVEMAIFRHRLERQLKENKEWFAATLQCIGHGVIVADPEGKVTLMNPIAELLTGWNQEDARGQEVSMIFHLVDEQTRETVLPTTEWTAGRSAFLMSKDGREIPIVIKVTPNHEGPRISGFVISFLDITERKRLEHLKDEFVSTVSHELRTPMMIIRESISQVLDGIHGETNEKQKNFLSLSLRGIDRLGRIVNDLLDMSKIEAGELEFKRERVDFKRLVHEVAAGFASHARNKGITIKEMLPKGKLQAYLDKDKIIQVLTNLIGNSLKFTEKGWIQISASERENALHCSVQDTGRGISQDDLPKVFDKFQQFDRQSEATEKGTGLGLTICKGIIELHHGKIGVESEAGKGTTFRFDLPKFTAGDVLKEYLKHGIKDAVKQRISLSVIFFNLEAETGKRKGTFLLHRMEKIVKQGLRRKSDRVLKENKSIFVLLLFTSEEGAKNVMQRLLGFMEKYLTEHDLSGLVSVHSKVMTFHPAKMTGEEFLQNFSSALKMINKKGKNEKLKVKILVVDDELDALQLIESRLEANGYSVVRASDGETAIAIAKREIPDLIILDRMLSKTDGLIVCKTLKSDPVFAKIPILLFTAKAQKMDVESGEQAGADAYITKPIEPKVLLDKVQELLSKRKK